MAFTWHLRDPTGNLASFPGSPLEARGEPGNEAKGHLFTQDTLDGTNSVRIIEVPLYSKSRGTHKLVS